MKHFILILSLLLLSSCSLRLQEGILPDFTKVEYLIVKDSIDLESLEIFRPTSVLYKDGYLVFRTATEWQELQFLNLENMHVSTKKFLGQGPDEVTTYSVVDHYGAPEIRIIDPNQKKILSINLDSVRIDDSIMPRFLMDTPERKRLTRGFENNRFIYYVGFLEEGWFMCYDKLTHEVTYYEDYPENEATSSLPTYTKSVVNGGTNLYGNIDHLVAKNRGFINFYEIAVDGSLERKAARHYFSPHFFLSETGKSASWSSKDVIGFTGGCSNEEYLYFLYSDMTFNEKGMDAQNCPYLMSFDWNGNPQCEYHLEKPLWDVAINGRTLYGLSRENEAIIYIYEMK